MGVQIPELETLIGLRVHILRMTPHLVGLQAYP